ncbi:MAG: PDC sensor domain-containing protein [Candidatus Competibacterales bacterium]
MKLGQKLTLLLGLILVIAVGLTLYLNQSKFRRLYNDVEQSRFIALAVDINQTIERGFNLGLALSQLVNVQEIVERRLAQEPQLIGIYVFDETGRMLFRAERATNVRASPDPLEVSSWLERLNADREPWIATAHRSNTAGIALVNNFGVLEGGVALVYDRMEGYLTLVQVFIDQLLYGGAALMAALLLGGWIIGHLSRRILAEIVKVRPAAKALEENASDDAPGEGDPGGQHSPGAANAAADPFVSQLQKLKRQLHEAERQLERVDP